jgi:hypothetical protein
MDLSLEKLLTFNACVFWSISNEDDAHVIESSKKAG